MLLSRPCWCSISSGGRRGQKWSCGTEHKIRSWNTGTVSFCVCPTFIRPQDQVNSCLGRPASSELKSRYCVGADVTHECKASSGAWSTAGACHVQCTRWFPSSVPLQIKPRLVVRVICDRDLLRSI